MGFRPVVFDCRPELATRTLFPTAEEVICGDFTSIKDHLTVTEEDFVVIMTNGHMHDFQVEEQILRGPFAYVGVIGSRTKTASVNQRLREAGIPEESIAQIHTPIGTAIRAVTPAEIAVSIAGEMILCRAERRGDKPHGCPHALNQKGRDACPSLFTQKIPLPQTKPKKVLPFCRRMWYTPCDRGPPVQAPPLAAFVRFTPFSKQKMGGYQTCRSYKPNT